MNGSVEAKRQADEAARQAQAYTQQRNNGYSGGGYTAPQQSTPQINGGGSSRGFVPYTPQKPGDTIFGPATINESCASGGYCPIG